MAYFTKGGELSLFSLTSPTDRGQLDDGENRNDGNAYENEMKQ
jgi:hypothetical protein